MPATDAIDFEREFADVVRELRALPAAAPAAVRERVRALGEPVARRSLPLLPWRRSLLVLAPVCVLGLVVAAVVHGVLNSAPKRWAAESHGAAGSAVRAKQPAETQVFGQATATPNSLQSPLVPPTGGRHQDYD